jgi:hypothetical protein
MKTIDPQQRWKVLRRERMNRKRISPALRCFSASRLPKADSTPIRTTLYDLIGAVNEEIPPQQDELVIEVVLHLLKNRPAKFLEHSWREGGFG